MADDTTTDDTTEPPARDDEVLVPVGPALLEGRLTIPPGTVGVVVFAHGSGSSRHSPRNRRVARLHHRSGLGTMLFDLLTPDEAAYRTKVFDVDLLARRLRGATAWLRAQPGLADVPVGWFGASTGAAAALWAAAEPDCDTAAVVSRGGRPDLAEGRLGTVRAPTLLIVGECDPIVWSLNSWARQRLACRTDLIVVPGATHLFEEPGALDVVAQAARSWFLTHLRRISVPPTRTT